MILNRKTHLDYANWQYQISQPNHQSAIHLGNNLIPIYRINLIINRVPLRRLNKSVIRSRGFFRTPVLLQVKTCTSTGQMSLAACQAGSLLKLGALEHPLACQPCKEVAAFIIPLSEGDVFNGALPQSQPPSVALCGKHWGAYNQYRKGVKCHIPQCLSVGTPCASTEGGFENVMLTPNNERSGGNQLGKRITPAGGGN